MKTIRGRHREVHPILALHGPVRVLLLALVLLFAGCTTQPDPESQPARAIESNVPYAEATQTLRFAAQDFEQTQMYEGTFPVPNLCNAEQCNGQLVLIDLTPQVPADAPVELAITLSTTSCVDQGLVLDQAFIVRQSWVEDTLAAVVVREKAGTVHLEMRHCSMLSLDEPNGVAYTVEARTVVRASVLPQFLPVRADLKPGESIELTGEGAQDVETFVIVPPQQNPQHLETRTFNVTDDMPAGSYIILVKGADVTLLGPNTTLSPVRIQVMAGDPYDIASDQTTEWSTDVSGLPVWAYLDIASTRERTEVTYSGNLAFAILQGTAALAEEARDDCPAICTFGGGALSYWSTGVGLQFFAKDLQRGALTFRVEAGPTEGIYATATIGYIADV